MVNSGKQLIPCETKISAYTAETAMPPWPLRLTPFPRTSGFLTLGNDGGEIARPTLKPPKVAFPRDIGIILRLHP